MAGILRTRGRLAVTVGVGTVLIAITAVAGRGLAVGSSNSPLFVTQLSTSPDWSSGEGWVVANPLKPQQVTADWTSFPWPAPAATVLTPPGPRPIQCGEAYSNDGGKTWVQSTLPPFEPDGLPINAGACVDPTLALNSKGTLYAISDGGSVIPDAGTSDSDPDSDMVSLCCSFTHSSDGGRTWSTPTRVTTLLANLQNTRASGSLDLAFDRPWLSVDPVTGTLYLSLSDDALIERVVFVSHDGGAHWSVGCPLDPNLQSAWADTISAANGVLSAAYSVNPDSFGYLLSLSPAVKCDHVCAVFETSTDDGRTWSRHVLPAPKVMPSVGVGPLAPGIEVAADPSTKGRYAVLLPATTSLSEVWVTGDSGMTWTQTRTINARNGDTVTKPWIAYGPTGALGVVWRDLHANESYDVYAIVSTNGGRNFGSAVELTPGTAPTDPPPGGTPGDDCACSLYLDSYYLYTTWGDARSGHLQVWYARYRY